MKLPIIYCKDEQCMQLAAALFVDILPAKALVFLDADLGMGKTFFTQACIKQFGYSGKIKSPTYTLVEEYHCLRGKILHFDLYRLADSEELEYIGIWDYLEQSAISFIEWPQKGQGVLPTADVTIKIEDAESTGRLLTIEVLSEALQPPMQQLQQQLRQRRLLLDHHDK